MSAAAHAAHDPLLIARLYGDDLDQRDLERARELVAACQDCSALLAEYTAIASATASLPVPARPRDFRLTEADGARLRPRAAKAPAFGWLGFVRPIGNAFVAVGLAGVVIAGSLSLLLPGASLLDNGPRAGSQLSASEGSPSSSPPDYTVGSPEANGDHVPSPSGSSAVAAYDSPGTKGSGDAGGPGGASTSSGSPTNDEAPGGGGAAEAAGPGGPDLLPAVLIGSFGLLVLGLAIVLTTRRSSRRV
jgi:anti-sigma factor RsiW